MDTELSELKMNDRKKFCLHKFSRREIGKMCKGQSRREEWDQNEIKVVTHRRGHEEP